MPGQASQRLQAAARNNCSAPSLEVPFTKKAGIVFIISPKAPSQNVLGMIRQMDHKTDSS